VHGVRDLALLGRPLEQEGGDGVVEHLVRPRRRHRDVVVDAAQGDRVDDRLGGRRVGQRVPRDHQPALGVRVELAHPLEHATAGHPRERPRREHQGQLDAGVGQRGELPQRLLGIARARDPVVVAVALHELGRHAFESGLVSVDDEEDGKRHREC
jgi:hypothetical protein